MKQTSMNISNYKKKLKTYSLDELSNERKSIIRECCFRLLCSECPYILVEPDKYVCKRSYIEIELKRRNK